MKVIVAGSRNIEDAELVMGDINYFSIFDCDVTEVVSGTARGVDTIGERWAERVGVPVTRFPADWKKYGKRAGPIRNEQMAKYADALLAIWDGKSRGTANMVSLAEREGLYVKVVLCAKATAANRVVSNG